MKKVFFTVLTLILIMALVSSACAATITLPYKMERQLQNNNGGLDGSFVIHSNADPEVYPLLYALRNVEFDFRGLEHDGDIHAYIFQQGENAEMTSQTELYRKEDRFYIRSDFLEDACYLLPSFAELVNSDFQASGENPSVLPDLLRMIYDGLREEEDSVNTEMLEKQIEMWISGIAPNATVTSRENEPPTLTQVYTIPLESVFNTVKELIQTISSNETILAELRKYLNQQQIDAYLNPNLGYYYAEAMKSLNLQGDLVFSRTVSTMGDFIHSSLTLPLDEGKTGYSTAVIESNELRKSLTLTGSKGLIQIELPVVFRPNEESFSEEIRFVRIDSANAGKQNLSIRAKITKTHDVYDDENDDTKTHETDLYTLHLERDTTKLPEQVSEDMIPDLAAVDAKLELHYSSNKYKLSSPTTLEITCDVTQGDHSFALIGQVKTVSVKDWVFSPFDIQNAVQVGTNVKEQLESLRTQWIEKADKQLVRTPGENMPAENSAASAENGGESATIAGGEEESTEDASLTEDEDSPEAEAVPIDAETADTEPAAAEGSDPPETEQIEAETT